jgi:hypothetical protein
MQKPKSKCQGCDAVWNDDQLKEIEHLGERVAPGEQMPSGECPDQECGALCHPIQPREINAMRRRKKTGPGKAGKA